MVGGRGEGREGADGGRGGASLGAGLVRSSAPSLCVRLLPPESLPRRVGLSCAHTQDARTHMRTNAHAAGPLDPLL